MPPIAQARSASWAHAATRDEAEAVGAALSAGGYEVECALIQSVDLDTSAWSERERSVAFLLSGRRKEERTL